MHEIVTSRVIRDKGDPSFLLVRIPRELLRHAHIDSMAEVEVRLHGTQVVIEAVQSDTEWMDHHAEEFVTAYRNALRALGDPEFLDDALPGADSRG